jgi:hypothetical protein
MRVAAELFLTKMCRKTLQDGLNPSAGTPHRGDGWGGGDTLRKKATIARRRSVSRNPA